MIPLKRFYLIRHGETVANSQEITCGASDSPLNSIGKCQAEEAARLVAMLPDLPRKIYHSSLSRARDTATQIALSCRSEVHEVPGLNEQDFGQWEGQPWLPALDQLVRGVEPPGGETNQEFVRRIQSTFHFLLSNHLDESVPLIVCHGGIFHALGNMYGHQANHIGNCNLYLFEPGLENTHRMPWSTFAFIRSEDGVSSIRERIYFE